MFWSANYISMRELKFLLKEENVTLTQILEADDILQECKADNNALIRFLTRPEILAELVTLIIEEPPKDVELTSQYRHSNIACEVLTSQLSSLSHRLCMDVVQMNRLCDFVSQDPPLNPLLASYFSRTIETLLKRSPKQDCYLHHIVCLRALDFFKARRDFLPNLLKHMATSAIVDTFKYLILCLGEPFNKIIMEWLDEHQFLENLIQIVCCNYEPEEIQPIPVSIATESQNDLEKGVCEESEKEATNHKDCDSSRDSDSCPEAARRALRMRAVASANASALAAELAAGAGDAWPVSSWCAQQLAARLRSEPLVRALLQGCFTSAPQLRAPALVGACRLLRALTHSDSEEGAVSEEELSVVERAVAPHLPLLHHALLQEPPPLFSPVPAVPAVPADPADSAPHAHTGKRRVGAARVQVAALVARLAGSREADVRTALCSLGTPGLLVDMFFAFPENNFLHAQVCALLAGAARGGRSAEPVWRQLLEGGDLLTRLMDAFERNEDDKERGERGWARDGNMGHVIALCRTLWQAAAATGADTGGDTGAGTGAALGAPEAVARRWDAFVEGRLRPLLARLDAPLGGEYPSDTVYETGNMESAAADSYQLESARGDFPQPDSAGFDDERWEDSPSDTLDMDEAAQLPLCDRVPAWDWPSEWDAAGAAEGGAGAAEGGAGAAEGGAGAAEGGAGAAEGGAGAEGEGWAQFGSDVCLPPADPFATPAAWPDTDNTSANDVRHLQLSDLVAAKFGEALELTNNWLSALSCMEPDALAAVVGDGLAPETPASALENPASALETPALVPETPVSVSETPVSAPETPALDPETPASDPETPASDPVPPASVPEIPDAPSSPLSPPQPSPGVPGGEGCSAVEADAVEEAAER